MILLKIGILVLATRSKSADLRPAGGPRETIFHGNPLRDYIGRARTAGAASLRILAKTGLEPPAFRPTLAGGLALAD